MVRPVAAIGAGVLLPPGIKTDRYREELVVMRDTNTADREGNTIYERVDGFYDHPCGFILPRSYGMGHVHKYAHEVYTAPSYEVDTSELNEIRLRPVQVPIVDALEDAILSGLLHGPSDFLMKAPTGTGKTVMVLEALRRVGMRALVVVDQEKLLTQWIERAEEHLGLDPSTVGIIQGKRFMVGDFLTIGMIQTMYRKAIDIEQQGELLNLSTITVFDETHIVGAPMFSQVCFALNSPVRFGVSATPNRHDAMGKVLHWHLGSVEIELKVKRKKSSIRYVKFPYTTSWYAINAKNAGRYISEIAENPLRNHMLANILVNLYDKGRTVLALSDRTAQLSSLKGLLIALGVPEEDIGICARNKSVWKYEKDPTPRRLPYGAEPGAEYSPLRLSYTQVRVPQAEIDASVSKPIVLATYGMFEKGVDVPDLDTGVDLTPRGKAEQAHGRILREKDGKKTPMWVTIRDYNSSRSEVQFANRLRDYGKSNVEVFEWNLEKGVRKADLSELVKKVRSHIADLRERRIEMNADGNYIVRT